MNGKVLGAMPANPISRAHPQGGTITADGITLRQHYVGQAMKGIRAAMSNGRADYECVARMAINQADALLAELAKEPQS